MAAYTRRIPSSKGWGNEGLSAFLKKDKSNFSHQKAQAIISEPLFLSGIAGLF